MRWPAFLMPRRWRPLTAAQRDQLRDQIDAALAKRKAGRAARIARSRKGAETKRKTALRRDPLMRDAL